MMRSGLQFRERFVWKVAIAITLVVIGDLLFFQWNYFGGYLGAFGLALVAGMVAARHPVRRDKRAWIAASGASVFAFAMIYDASLLAWTLFWIAAGMAALLPATGAFDDGWRWFQRLLLHALRSPFAPIFDTLRVVRVRRARQRSRFSLRAALPVIGLPLIGSAVIIALFAAANPVLEKLISTISIPDLTAIDIVRIMLWVLLFIMAWSLIHPRLARRIFPTFDGRGDLAIRGVSVASVRLSLIVFNLLFALQNLMDAAYLNGMVQMPSDITLAEYAHRGAYPLIATALLAGLFVIITLRPGSATAANSTIRKLVFLWIAQNIVLVGSSIVRTLDYVEAYSLTILRISALVWMVLVAIGLVLICWRLIADKSASWLINANLAAATLLLTAICFIDLGNIAAWWNVRHAKEVGGSGSALDLCYLENLGSSSLLPLISLERRNDLTPNLRAQIQATRMSVLQSLEWQMKSNWTMLGAHRLEQATRELALLPPVTFKSGHLGCGGLYVPYQATPEFANEAKARAIPENARSAAAHQPKSPSALTAETQK